MMVLVVMMMTTMTLTSPLLLMLNVALVIIFTISIADAIMRLRSVPRTWPGVENFPECA